MSDYIMAVTTIGDEDAAASLAKQLLARRVVACVQIVPKVRSLYRWKGRIEDDAECVLLLKTRADCYDALASAIGELHDYDVPELVALPIERGSAAYLGWLDENVTATDGGSG